MIRISLFLALFCVSTAITAQEKHSVFLSKSVVSWYHTTINNFEESVSNLASDDMNVKIKSKKEIKTNLKLINKNSKSMSLKMAGFLRDERIKELGVGVMTEGGEKLTRMDQVNHSIRNNEDLVEIKMSKKDLATFDENLAAIKKADEILANANYQLWSNDTRKSAFQSQLRAIAQSARANGEFLIAKSVN